MSDQRADNLAKLLVNYSVNVREGELVSLRVSDNSIVACLPMLQSLYREVLKAGGNPYVHIQPESEEFAFIFFDGATDLQIQYVNPATELLIGEIDCDITLIGNQNTRHLSQVDPRKESLRRRSRKNLVELFRSRVSEGDLNWVAAAFPTSGQAQDAEMSLEEYEDFVYQSTYADMDDPVKKWEAIQDRQQRLIRRLDGKDQVEITGEHIDLQMSIKGRTFLNSCGLRNMPDGEIFTGPVETSVSGRVRFSYPCILRGREVIGAELVFEDGKVIEARADKNEAFLNEMIKMDEGASYVGELGIGTNEEIQQFTGNMLFDEKIAGSIHLALGNGYPETGSKNRSGIHWDLVTDMQDGGQIIVDGDLLYESGEFTV